MSEVINLTHYTKDSKQDFYITICKRWIRVEESLKVFDEEENFWEDYGFNVIDGVKVKRPISQLLRDLPEKEALKKMAELKLFKPEFINYLMTLKVA